MSAAAKFLIAFALFLSFSIPLAAQDKGGDLNNMAGFRTEFSDQLDDVEQKIIDLAQAIPAKTYSWRPMKGVRSVGEVFTHIAGANYLFPSFVGHKGPKDYQANLDKITTDKDKIINEIGRAHV